MNVFESISRLYVEFNLPEDRSRRDSLIREMERGQSIGIDCRNCSGHCCTFTSNSMQITPLEGFEIYRALVEKDRFNNAMIESLKSCIRDFRLDRDLGNGKKSIRRTYTCPFYKSGSEGCLLSRSVKPYGCLAFNPFKKGAKGEGGCLSSVKNLEKREKRFFREESLANEFIKELLDLAWDKSPIPRALLEISEKINI